MREEGGKATTALEFHSAVSTGKKNKLRVYYLSWLRNRILHYDPEVEKKQGWITVGDLEGCIHYKVGKAQFGRMSIPSVGFNVFSVSYLLLMLCVSPV